MTPEAKRDPRRLVWLCAIVYFCSYLTRINYSAVLVEMVNSEGFSRADASAAVTALFITYGVGQLISGFLGDRLRPQSLIFCGLLVSSAMNLLIPICPGTVWMTAVWCVNGFAQAMMWPPLVRIMAELLTEEDYKTAVVRVSWGSSFGTVFVYLAAPVCITLSGWRLVFCICAAAATVMAFVWIKGYHRLEGRMRMAHAAERTTARQEGDAAPQKRMEGWVYGLLAGLMLAIVSQGLLRDGITTWMPSYISDSFDLGSAVAILTSVVLPLFSVLSLQAASLLSRKVFRNEVVCSVALFACGAASLLLLRLLNGSVFALSVAALTLTSGCMHGVNLLLICTVPKYFQRTGKTSTVSGILNACTYIGSALSTYGVAVLTDRFGWGVTVTVWLAVAVFGGLCCLISMGRWKRFSAEG